MRYRSYKYFLLLISLLTGSGCEKYIHYVNAPEFEQKLVITSFISPSDTVSKIFVSSNQPLYSFSEKLEGSRRHYGHNQLTEQQRFSLIQIQPDFISAASKMPVIPGNNLHS